MTDAAEYRVLARKYRPTSFAELIGHDTLVRTLSNAFSSGRIAHAFMLTGVRGVGKTSTARLLARALNCTGPDGTGKSPTMTPCGVCAACKAIAEDRHPDVIEMDAASRTGVDNMRELLDGVRYHPTTARYKVYVIDEVHMLSKPAFNALLKTLEEPPADVKFIFATTEIDKVPITVLSRCQRYTLPRIPSETLAGHFTKIAETEGIGIEPGAIALIARAADGSVRDGLSVLDQAIALAHGETILETAVREMLGVADRGLILDLFEALMRGDAAAALERLEILYNGGTDPAMVIQDLLEVTHFVTRMKLERPGEVATMSLANAWDIGRGRALAARLGMAVVARTWQMLLKGLTEVQHAPQPLKAAEMVLVRLVYVTDLPPPAELIRRLEDGVARGGPTPTAGPGPGGPGRPMAIAGGGRAVAEPVQAQAVESGLPRPATFDAALELIAARREGILYGEIARHLHLVRYEPGAIEFRPEPSAPRDLATRLGAVLGEITGIRWMITVSREAGAPTLLETTRTAEEAALAAAEADPKVQEILRLFPGARIERVTRRDAPALPPLEPVSAPVIDEPAPALYDEDDPGPFAVAWDEEFEGEDP
jgi:DNA polymerase-3 subunit gamma/tau